MRYKLSIDRTVNRLVPHYLSGRRFILFVQSCLYPLQCTNERFRDFTKEMHIRARMTSQVIYFEWFLNYKFGKYIRYNPQIEMFARFKTKSSFHKTKRII